MKDNLDELRHIEGFPIGEDEDLHALSDPPHYTAYPNPHIAEFIKQVSDVYDGEDDNYQCEPFVGDVSEGKSSRIYRVHSYHTKVPHLAIIEFIKHYTQEGDVVLDCFAGTGMTGVAAQLTGRNCVLIELSPLASSIAYSLNTSTGQDTLIRDANKIVEEVEKQFGNLVQAEISGEKYPLAYCVWAAKLSCPYCGTNFNLWDVSVDEVEWDEIEEFTCPKCQAELTYTDCNKVREENGFTEFEPVRVSIVQGRKRVERRPNASDLKRIAQAQVMTPAYWYPDYSVADGDKLSEPKQAHGLTRVSQFFTKRNLLILSHLWAEVVKNDNIMLRAAFTASLRRLTRFNRYMAKHKLNRSRELVGPLAKTVHIPAIFFEANPLIYFKKKAREYSRLKLPDGTGIRISTQSATDMPNIPSNSIDYIFTDPPFGANIQYSELNFVTESWLRAFTNASREAIISGAQDKRENDYYSLIYDSFRELYRILKPGRWLTVEFHSSSSTIWNLIQSALAHSGFIVAQVAVLDKQKGTINQLTSPSSVNNDLIINAYKPRNQFTERLLSRAGQGMEAEFVRQHLAQLPVSANVERTQEMLYSKYLAYYVQRGYHVAYNAEQFYRALPQWGFEELDDYWFADEAQANEYERQKARQSAPEGKHARTQDVLFISDERSARRWLWNFLAVPRTYGEIYNAFVKALQTSEDEIPEPTVLLEEGFVRTNGHWKRPDTLTREELERKRQQRLLRQFNDYRKKARSGQRLKEVRKAALLAGFTEAYREGRFGDIVTVGQKLDRRLLEDSPDLQDFIEIAEARLEA